MAVVLAVTGCQATQDRGGAATLLPPPGNHEASLDAVGYPGEDAAISTVLSSTRPVYPDFEPELELVERGDRMLAFAEECAAWLKDPDELIAATEGLLQAALDDFASGAIDRWEATDRSLVVLHQLQTELVEGQAVIQGVGPRLEELVLAPLRLHAAKVGRAIEASAGNPHRLDLLAQDLQLRMDHAASLQGVLADAHGEVDLRRERVHLLMQALRLERQVVGRRDARLLMLQQVAPELRTSLSAF